MIMWWWWAGKDNVMVAGIEELIGGRKWVNPVYVVSRGYNFLDLASFRPLHSCFSLTVKASRTIHSLPLFRGLIDRLDASKFPTQVGGQMRGFKADGYIDGKKYRRLHDCLRYCIVAGKKAIEDADIGGDKLSKDYGVNKNSNQKNRIKDAKSQLAPALSRTAMMELEINMAEMPLWKLSKSNIQKGEKAELRIPESLIVGAVAGIS
ncbi:hypothetical protein L1887_10941 [Cichorium endivia]|nr:hypothetical protein L1887_10941 [Cichorium endivia]